MSLRYKLWSLQPNVTLCDIYFSLMRGISNRTLSAHHVKSDLFFLPVFTPSKHPYTFMFVIPGSEQMNVCVCPVDNRFGSFLTKFDKTVYYVSFITLCNIFILKKRKPDPITFLHHFQIVFGSFLDRFFAYIFCKGKKVHKIS